MAANGPLWTLVDEAESREYHVFPWFEADDDDEPDARPVLTDVAVIEALLLDEGGRIVSRDVGPAARRHDERAWQLLRKDRGLRDLMETAAPVVTAVAAETASSADDAQAAILESLRDLLHRRRAGRGLRDVS